MNYTLEDFQKWLERFSNFEKRPDARLFRLETTEGLAGLFGHPEKAYKTYHVTGSKGKGSLSKMLACILSEKEGGEQIGVYASPHVYDFRERVSGVNGFFSDGVYCETVREFIEKVTDSSHHASWFELVTSFAFLTFKNAGVHHAVFEVGMGGRLDATNIIQPEVSCITEVELEHMQFLGDTLEKIAFEKAGIIKPGVPAVIAPGQDAAVKKVFREVAQERRAPIFFVDELARVEGAEYRDGRLRCEISGEIFNRPLRFNLKMLGEVQATNALQAAVAMKTIYPELDEKIIERGLEKATLPGRFERRGNLILDGSHTPESIRGCVETFLKIYPTGPRNLLFGIAADKEVERIAPLFKDGFEKIFITRPGDFKKSDLAATEAVFSDFQIPVVSGEDYREIITRAAVESKNIPLLVTGSFYLLDEVDKILSQTQAY